MITEWTKDKRSLGTPVSRPKSRAYLVLDLPLSIVRSRPNARDGAGNSSASKRMFSAAGRSTGPALRALDACRSGEVSGIVVAKLDRLSRSLVDFAALLVEAQAKRFNIVALDLGVDLSTPAGEFLASVMASAAQWERRIIGQLDQGGASCTQRAGSKARSPRSPEGRARQTHCSDADAGHDASGDCRQAQLGRRSDTPGGQAWRPSSVRVVLNRKRLAA